MADENVPGDAPTMSEDEFTSNFEPTTGPASAPKVPPTPPRFSPPSPVERKEEVPRPEIRTMQSDMNLMGGKSGMSVPPAVAETGEPVFKPETVSQMERTVESPAGGGKKLSVAVGIIVGILVLGGAGYYFLYPMLFPPLNEPAPVAETPEVPATPAPTVTHVTSFALAPTATVEAVIDADTAPALAAAVELESARPLSPNSIKEVVIKTPTGLASFRNVLGRLAVGGTDMNQVFWDGANFESDFTAFIFYDTAGSWPGYIAKIKPTSSGDAVLTAARGAEGVMRLENMYPPIGNLAFQVFKDGQANNIPTRYSVGSLPGASLNYGVFGNYFVIGTSYNGLKAVLPLLGL